MVSIRVFLYTIYTYIVALLLSCIYVIPAVLIACIPEKYRYSNKIVYWFVYSFYVVAQKCSLLHITYSGIEHIPDTPVIFAANHQSSLDIPLLGALCEGTSHVWLARKDILKRFWFLSFIISRLSVLVDVATPRAGMISLLRIAHLVKQAECDIMIFPEGSRFVSGTVNDFYGGFVILARRLNRPIIPVYIDGVHKIYPPHSWWAKWGRIRVIVGKPMVLGVDEVDAEFKKRVHQWFLDQVR